MAMQNIFESGNQGKRKYCDECERTSETKYDVKSHMTEHGDPGETFQSLFLSHHDEVTDPTENQCSDISWEVLLSEEEAAELTETEKKEMLKLDRYFTHRSGQKLWENLFHPAGRSKGKKETSIQGFGKL